MPMCATSIRSSSTRFLGRCGRQASGGINHVQEQVTESTGLFDRQQFHGAQVGL
jgi:hypothetical protein